MPQVSGNQELRPGRRRAFQKPVVVLVARRLHRSPSRHVHSSFCKRAQQRVGCLAPGLKLGAPQHLPVLRQHFVGDARLQCARNRHPGHARLQPAGLQACRNQNVCVEHHAHQTQFATIDSMKDDLGRRLKRDYEDALRLFLPRRTYVVIRIDGRAFHKFTEGLERPYCRALADALDQAALCLCQEMIGCRFAYGQSDEYSFLLTDFEREDSALWFDGNVQKIVSVSASIFTAAFSGAVQSSKLAAFDSRVMVISQRAEVERYFLWRQLDASANSLNMLASAHYRHHELEGKSTAEKHELLHAKGVNWATQSADFKRGRAIRRTNAGWTIDLEIPIFNRDRAYLDALIPTYNV